MTTEQLQAMTKEQLIKWCEKLQARNARLDDLLKKANAERYELARRNARQT